MSKRYYAFPLFLLLFSFFTPPLVFSQDLVGLKNLSWEEQKQKTRIILETTQPLQYNVTASQTAAEIQVELSNLDLRNLPQELFINTAEVISLQTFPQAPDRAPGDLDAQYSDARPFADDGRGQTLQVAGQARRHSQAR